MPTRSWRGFARACIPVSAFYAVWTGALGWVALGGDAIAGVLALAGAAAAAWCEVSRRRALRHLAAGDPEPDGARDLLRRLPR